MMQHLLSTRRLPSRKLLVFIPVVLILYLLLPGQSSKLPPNPKYGLVDETAPSTSRVAIATFLSAGDHPVSAASDFSSDDYLAATRTLLYQLLHGPETKINMSNIDVLVLVSPDVPPQTRNQLSVEGALVIEAHPIPLRWWIKTGVTRWKDQFLKLRLFEQTQYKRLLFMDADTLLTSSIDALFSEQEVVLPAPTIHQLSKMDEFLPNQYVFAARSNNHFTGQRQHPFPPLNTDVFSAGFWVAAPSKELFAYLLSVMDHYRRFDPHTMEQSLLNYAFRRGGPMPWRELHYKWSATWPSSRDLAGGVVSLHEKFWTMGPEELQMLWTKRKDEMERFWSEQRS